MLPTSSSTNTVIPAIFSVDLVILAIFPVDLAIPTNFFSGSRHSNLEKSKYRHTIMPTECPPSIKNSSLGTLVLGSTEFSKHINPVITLEGHFGEILTQLFFYMQPFLGLCFRKDENMLF